MVDTQNEFLNIRYHLLFEEYNNSDFGFMAQIKDKLRAMVYDGTLRPDAALYLISNLDLMIARPYFGHIHAVGENLVYELETVLPRENALESVDTALNLVLEALDGERPYSSHSVSRAVEKSWRPLSKIFGWA